MLAQDKCVVVYGAAGHIGSAVARAFAREGAQVREHMEQSSALRRLPTLRELADAAVMVASTARAR